MTTKPNSPSTSVEIMQYEGMSDHEIKAIIPGLTYSELKLSRDGLSLGRGVANPGPAERQPGQGRTAANNPPATPLPAEGSRLPAYVQPPAWLLLLIGLLIGAMIWF